MQDWNAVIEYYEIIKKISDVPEFRAAAEALLRLIPKIRQCPELVNARPGSHYVGLTLDIHRKTIYIALTDANQYLIVPDYRGDTRNRVSIIASLDNVIQILQGYMTSMADRG